MQISVRTMAFTIVLLFVGSLMAGLTSEYNGIEPEILEEETIVQNPSQATSPGHVVFGQYISSDNCGHCSKTGGGSDAHHAIKQNHPDEYVYVTYMSASYGDTDTARAGNVAPYNWAWTTGGAPDAYLEIEQISVNQVRLPTMTPMILCSRAVVECTAPLTTTA